MRKILLLIPLAPFFAFAQTDSASLNRSQRFVVDPALTDHDIYNGKEHLGYLHSIAGTAYWHTNEWQPGSIVYRGVLYPAVYLKFDLVQNEVIIRHPNGYTGITLFTPRIQGFTISGEKFVLFTKDNELMLPAGIYQEITAGKISLYVRRLKQIEEIIATTGIERRFVENDTYYAVKDGRGYLIRKEKNLLDLAKEQRAAIKTHLKQMGLSFRSAPEAVLNEIVTYYNNATN
jgi:hypothetical protein